MKRSTPPCLAKLAALAVGVAGGCKPKSTNSDLLWGHLDPNKGGDISSRIIGLAPGKTVDQSYPEYEQPWPWYEQ